MAWQGKSALIAKRVLDVSLSVVLIGVLLPLGVFISLWVWRDSKGPIVFRQVRIGQGQRPFILLKFRTMEVGSEGAWRPPTAEEFMDYVFQDHNDPRITEAGRWLRAHSWDELPQLVNVLLGDMSLVGPRPEIPQMVSLYRQDMHRRHTVRPGITGLAQVSGRSNLSTQDTLYYDLLYVDSWSFGLDLIILWKTLKQLFVAAGR